MDSKFIRHKIPIIINVSAFYTFHYHEYAPSFVFQGESHDFWELVYVDTGTVFFSRDHQTEEIATSGQCIFHQPNIFHTIRANQSAPANVFIITFESKSTAMQFFKDKKIALSTQEKNLLKNIFNAVTQNFQLEAIPEQIHPKVENSYAFQLVKLHLEIFLLSLSNSSTKSTDVRPIAIETAQNEIIEFLKHNLYAPLKLSDICQTFHYQKSALCKQFKETTNRTIFEYLTHLRIEEAKKLIKTTPYSFSKISKDLCFKSYSTFVKTFKKITKLTPSEYKMLLI